MANDLTYTFESTPELEQFLDGMNIEKEPRWAALAKHLSSLNAQMLEGISTILFLRRGVAEIEMSARFLALKPHLANIHDKCEKEAKKLKTTRADSVPA